MHPPPPVPAPAPGGSPCGIDRPTPAPACRGDFLLVGCQGGAEAALCQRQQGIVPQASKAAWRRGVVTFRLADFDPPDDFFPELVYARSVIRSLGQVAAATLAERVAALEQLVPHPRWDNVHVWCRDPRSDADPREVRAAVMAAYAVPPTVAEAAAPGDLVLDCVIDTPDRWWVGWHRAGLPASRHPGGMHPVAAVTGKVSRAWLKLDEAIESFEIPLARGQRAVELGCAPGGACQRLLEAGLDVVGVDPAVVDPRVANHPRFEQWRMRARDVKLRSFRGFDWIVADMNIDPKSTLESIGRAVTAPGVRPMGIIATLKLPDWSRAAELPGWLELFGSWGFVPRARQLSTGGREVCVVALRRGLPVSRPATPRPGR